MSRMEIRSCRAIHRKGLEEPSFQKTDYPSGLCPRRQLKFKTTVAHKGRRYKSFGDFKLPSLTSGDATIDLGEPNFIRLFTLL